MSFSLGEKSPFWGLEPQKKGLKPSPPYLKIGERLQGESLPRIGPTLETLPYKIGSLSFPDNGGQQKGPFLRF